MQRDVLEVRADGRQRVRRGYSEAYKRRVVALTLAAGASVSRIAQQHGVNSNLLFTWRRRFGACAASGPTPAVSRMPAMLPVAIEPRRVEVNRDAAGAARRRPSDAGIEIEVGAGRVRLHGPVDLQRLEAVICRLERAR